MDQSASVRPFRVVSVDGGGLHALSYLPVLKSIEQHLGQTLSASGEFDLLVGTSTGAIVATALKLGATSEQIVAMYLRHARPIFRKAGVWNRLFYSYRSAVLRDVLAQFFRQCVSQSLDLTWRQLAEESRYPSLELVVTLWDVGRERTAFLSTRLDRPGQAEQLWDATVADVITACCSGPYFFPPRMFGTAAEVYCDGGITGLNNPATFGVSLVSAELRAARRPIDVLSFGSGESSSSSTADVIRNRSAVTIALNTIDALMNSSSRLMDRFHGEFGPALGIRRYLRTNHPRRPGSKLDDLAGIPEFVTHFEQGHVCYELTSFDGAQVARKEGRPPPEELAEWQRLWSEEFLLPRSPKSTQQILASNGIRDQHSALRPATIPSTELLPSVTALSIPILFAASVVGFLVMFAVAVWQWRAATAASRVATAAVRTLLQDDFRRYSQPPQVLGQLVVPPLANGFPFHQAAENESLKRTVLGEINRFERIPGSELDRRLQRAGTELERWETASPPHHDLRKAAADAALLFLKEYDAYKAKSQESATASYRDEQLRQERITVYRHAATVIEQLVSARDLAAAGEGEGPDAALHPYQEFYRLYYGGLLLVESPDVENLMIDLGKPWKTDAPLVQWAATGARPETLTGLGTKLIDQLNTELRNDRGRPLP